MAEGVTIELVESSTLPTAPCSAAEGSKAPSTGLPGSRPQGPTAGAAEVARVAVAPLCASPHLAELDVVRFALFGSATREGFEAALATSF